MKVTRTGKRRAAAINSVKVLLTSASLAATLGGWAVISSVNGSTLDVAQVTATTSAQAFLDSRSTTSTSTTASAAATSAATSTSTGAGAGNGTTSNNRTSVASASAATVAPTATAVPQRVVVQTIVRTRSSK